MARILVVDDDQAICTVAKTVLELNGHEAVVAADGRAGLRKIETENYDLLIVDIFMPGMDGLETIKLVNERRPGMPIIVISGLSFRSISGAQPDFLSMATKLGATRSLQKPFRSQELLSAVEECLDDPAGDRREQSHGQ
jgi:DNA-binding NtrC family response regulator